MDRNITKAAGSLLGKNLLQRIILFLFSIPALIGIIFLAPEQGHWPLNILLIALSIPSTFEAARLFGMNPKKTKARILGIFLIGILFPLVSFLCVLGVIEYRYLLPIYTAMVMIVLFMQVFRQQNMVQKISPSIGKHLAIIAYPGLFISHLILISKIPDASLLYLTFLIGVVANDTMAYLTGQLYRKYHDHPTALSPNKTTAGFIVGYLFSPVALIAIYYLAPQIFPGGLKAAIIMGLLIGFTTITGDLIESGLKRSVKQKDSGETIPGRGGVLDSMDSILYTAPVFFYGYQMLNNVWLIQ